MSARKQYIRVDVAMDSDGTMRPCQIHWTNGRKYEISRLIDVTPAPAMKAGGQGDRYTVLINGKERALFFERPTQDDDARKVGRWFVEVPNAG